MTPDPTRLDRGRAAKRAPGLGRRRFFETVLVLLAAALLSDAPPAHAQSAGPPLPDAVPTAWHEAAGLTPLLTAPPPPNPATICIIDTGVTPTPDLDITARWAYDGGTLDDVHATGESPGHGTLVAHFAAGAVNGWGGAGAFPHARISSVRVFPREGGASWREYIAAISRCSKLDPNTKVIVISIGGQEIEPGEAEELEAHIEQARNLYGASVVAAAGNGAGAVDFPARFPASLAVTATTADGTTCAFSAHGSLVDIAAPGCGVDQGDSNGGIWRLDGTSFAAPVVAGALAAIRTYAPQLSAVEAEQVLMDSAAAGRPPRLDGAAALRAVGAALPPSSAAGRVDGVAAPDARREGALPNVSHQVGIERGRRSPLRYARPRLSLRRRGTRVLIVAHNRPVGVWLQLRVRGHRVQRRSSRMTLRDDHLRHAHCRYTSKHGVSDWVHLRTWR